MVSKYRYVSFIWTQEQEKLDSFLAELNRCNSYLNFTYESSKTSIPLLDLKLSLSNRDLSTDLHIKSIKSMGKVIKKNLYLLYMNNEVKKVFTPKPMKSNN